MRGTAPLEAMRRSGNLPSRTAFVTDMPRPLSPMQSWERWESQGQFKTLLPDIDLEPADNPASLDFRCLTGLIVHITGFDSDRLDAIVMAIERVKPARVIASLHTMNGEAIRISDTAGHIQFPAE